MNHQNYRVLVEYFHLVRTKSVVTVSIVMVHTFVISETLNYVNLRVQYKIIPKVWTG